MKVVAFSDIHSQQDSLVLPDGDLLACAGDFSTRGELKETAKFIEWFSKQSERYTHGGVFISGNHDFLAQDNPSIFDSLVRGYSNILYLENHTVHIGGKVIHGSPQTPYFHGWAFNEQRGPDIKKYWEIIPDVCDLLITHGPPMNILDQADNGSHAGCRDLTEIINSKTVRHHIFGHIHESYGAKKIYHTHYYNVAVLDRAYQLSNPVTVFDI